MARLPLRRRAEGPSPVAAARAVVLRGTLLSPTGADRATVHPDGFVAVDGDGTIEAAGAWDDLPDRLERGARPVVTAGDALILPAFVDAHLHLPQIDVRGRYGLPLLPWLERHVYPAEAGFSDPDHAAAVAERFFTTVAASGVGAAGVFPTVHREATERAFEAAAVSGLRVVMGKVLMDRGAPEALLEPAEAGIADSLELAERWEGAAGGRLAYALTPRFAPACSAALLEAVGEAAAEAGLRIQTHLAEQPDEVAAVADLFPDAPDYLGVYQAAGMVREGAVFAHAIHCSDAEYRRVAGAGAAIACCPTSNAFLGSGAFPLARARATGVTVAVGSDVGAGPRFSPLDVLRHLAYLDRLEAEELLYRGTLAGAEALGLAGVCGAIEPGRSADLALLEPPRDATGTPLERFVQAIFRENEARTVATLVEGRVVHGALPASV